MSFLSISFNYLAVPNYPHLCTGYQTFHLEPLLCVVLGIGGRGIVVLGIGGRGIGGGGGGTPGGGLDRHGTFGQDSPVGYRGSGRGRDRVWMWVWVWLRV